MQDRAREVYGNKIPERTYRKAVKNKEKYKKKYGDDTQVAYEVVLQKNAHIGEQLGVVDVLLPESKDTAVEEEKRGDGW